MMKYTITLQSIAWVNGRRNEDSLEISPKFQRRPVWLEAERSELMSTICSGLPFPEIYIQIITNPADGKERHIVVDGQQRITSILMFIDGEVPLPVNDDWNGQYFRDLTDEQKEAFWDYKVVVRNLSQTNDAEIRDLFARLNTNNVVLNDQELRNAKFKGRFKQTAERMADNPLFESLSLFSPRDIRRMLDVEFASELLLLTVEGITNKKDLLDDAYINYEEEFPRETEYEEEFNIAIGLLRTLITNETRVGIKTRSNFYSLYGACLRYFRGTGRRAFIDPNRISRVLANLFAATRSNALEGWPMEFYEYFEAVARAASDRGRRASREKILCMLIEEAENESRVFAENTLSAVAPGEAYPVFTESKRLEVAPEREAAAISDPISNADESRDE